MLGKLIWENTGDEIIFEPVYPDLFEYYVDQLNQLLVNKFICNLSKFDQSMISNLESNLKTVFPLSKKIPFEISKWDGDVLDQCYLNQLHREWVKTGQKYPILPVLLRQLNLDNDYRQINSNLHALENSFYYEFPEDRGYAKKEMNKLFIAGGENEEFVAEVFEMWGVRYSEI